MSSPSQAALSHLEQREQELLAINEGLEERRVQILSGATGGHETVPPSLVSPSVRLSAKEAKDTTPSGPGKAQACKEEGHTRDGVSKASLPSQSSPENPESLRSVIRLQNARIGALQEELDKTIAELASRDSDGRQMKQDLKQLSEENARLQKNASDHSSERLKKQLAAAESRVKDLESERADLLKSKDQYEVQIKKHAAEGSTREARINRMTEECERLKHAMKDMGTQDKDRAGSDRKEIDRLVAEVRKLERQRTELVAAFKKQMKLIDILKRQRAHMEAARVLSFTEDEFIRILELGDKLGE